MKKSKALCIVLGFLLVFSTGCSSYSTDTYGDDGESHTSSGGAAKYAEWLADRLNAEMDGGFTAEGGEVLREGGTILLSSGNDAKDLSVDISGLRDEGYVIRSLGEDTVIVGRTDAALDRAVRRYAAECGKTGSLAVNCAEGLKIGKITLAGKDISSYKILLPKAAEGNGAFCASATENMKFAAAELSSYIEKACGFALPVEYVEGLDKMTDAQVSAAGYDAVVVILSDPTAKGGSRLEAGEMGCEDYRITAENGVLRILGGNMRGCMYGVYDFLEKYVGWRFLTAGVEYLYEADELNIDGVDYYESPAFEYRSCTYPGGMNENSFAKLRHNSYESWNYAEKPKYGYGIGTTFYHAHSFEYQIAGLSSNEQPCLSDPDILEEVIDSMCRLLDERIGWGKRIGYEINQISCSMNDNTNFCSCADCIAAIRETSFADLYLKFVNRAADVIVEKYPGVMVYTIAYTSALSAPVETVPRDNVIVHYCLQTCNQHEFQSGECADYPKTTLGASNVESKKNLEDWAALTDNLYIWYYSSSFFSTLVPSPNLYEMYSEMKYLADLGAQGFYAEGYYHCDYNFEDLKSYMFYKMMWNPDISREEFFALIDEYISIVYGEYSAPFIREYLDLYQEAGDIVGGCFTNNYSYPFDMVDIGYFRVNYEYMRSLFDNALRFAADEAAEEKIEILSCHMNLLGLSASYESAYVRGGADERAEFEARYGNLVDTVNKYGFTDWDNNAYPANYDLSKNPMFNFHPVMTELSREGRA